ncbi:MAG: phosphoenolpyruvate--protein phosphotransferase [Phascolarctobacterium sp.]|nr:phosphoenolpyruvate--protein phosphotransferase [Phascolarctobacterium sp.]
MITLQGKSVYEAIAIAPLHLLKHTNTSVEKVQVSDVNSELEAFHVAQNLAMRQLDELYHKALETVGEESAAIFEIHKMMLEDMDYVESIERIIQAEKCNAVYAVFQTGESFAEIFASMDDEYMQGRAADVKDISKRLIACLSGAGKDTNCAEGKYILLTDDLAPSETMQMDKKRVAGFVTCAGSANSHTAILARTLGIPAVVNTGELVGDECEGKLVIIDGHNGLVYIEPTSDLLEKYSAQLRSEVAERTALNQLKGELSVTKNGQHVNVYANIGNTADLDKVFENDAEGIGLFRSEFIYLESDDYPTEEKQFAIYKQVAEALGKKKVIIRTLDIGADKQAAYFNLPEEDNPALGYRAIRICLTRKELFKTQLRAICRASAYGKLAIMFPMIISTQEITECKNTLAEVMQELKAENIAFDENIEIGIMVETPAAALMTMELGKIVDFFSIGTNDLTQYTLAIDRQNQSLEKFFDAHHPAVLKLIEMTVQNAHANNIWAGICGELGADLSLTEAFVAMGIDELSVAPSSVLPLRAKIRSL